jgi:hypothetical protein
MTFTDFTKRCATQVVLRCYPIQVFSATVERWKSKSWMCANFSQLFYKIFSLVYTILLARTPTGSMVVVEGGGGGKWFGCNTTMENKCSFDSLLLRNEKVEISQYTKQGFPYVIGKTPKSSTIRSPLLLLRATNKYPPLSTSPFSADERCVKDKAIKAVATGFPLF